MCRNIRPLFNYKPKTTVKEIEEASLQYVRKISGFHHPSKINEKAFHTAVKQISKNTAKLLEALHTDTAPKNRAEEIAKARHRFMHSHNIPHTH